MPMTTILVELDSTAQGTARLYLSARLAARHDAHLIGLFVIPPSEPPMMFPGAIGGLSEIQAEYRERAQTNANTVQSAFESALEQNGVASEWRCLDGFFDDVIVTHARYADLVVVGQADPDRRSSSVAGEVTLRAGPARTRRTTPTPCRFSLGPRRWSCSASIPETTNISPMPGSPRSLRVTG